MVEKPTGGICSRCDSESLEFYDDGSGRCVNCGRTFRWASQEEIQKAREAQSEKQASTSSQQPQKGVAQAQSQQQNPQSQQQKPVSRPNGAKNRSKDSYTPSQGIKIAKEPTGMGFLWMGVIGIVLMMVGYILFSFYAMEIGLEEHHEIIRGLYLLLTSVGVLIAGMGMLVFGSIADHLDEHVRKGLVISSALLIALYLGLSQLMLFGF